MWGQVAGAAIGAGASLLGGGQDGPDLQPWKPIGQNLKKNFFPGTQDYYDQYGQGEGLWSGSELGGLDSNVTRAQNQMLGLAPQMQQQLAGLSGTLEGFLDYDPNSATNQAQREAFQAQAMNNFNTNLRPAVEDRATFSGQFGGPQSALALGRAGGDTMRDINSFEAQMMEADKARAMQAMGLAPGIINAQLLPSQMIGQVGEQRTARNQLEQLDEIQQYEAPRNNQLQSLMEYQNFMAPFSGLGGQGGNAQGSPSILQGALGGALLGQQFGGLFGGGGGGVSDWNMGNQGNATTTSTLSDLGIL